MIHPLGSITLSPIKTFTAGERVTLTFTYTAGVAGIANGGALRIRTPNDGWGEPLAHRAQLPKKIEGRSFDLKDSTICTHNRCNLSVLWKAADPSVLVEVSAEVGVGPLSQFIVATVKAGSIQEHDMISVVYGDRRWGEDGVKVQRVAPTPGDAFIAHLDPDGDGRYHPLHHKSLCIDVRPGPVSNFNLVAPAMVKPGEPFSLRIAGTDEFRNVPDETWEGILRLGSKLPQVTMPGEAEFTANAKNHIEVAEIATTHPGVHSFIAEPVTGGNRNRSNPVLVSEQDMRIYFGDLHCHSMYHGDGRSIGAPDELYAYGRYIAGLDFMAITDGGGWKNDGWEESQTAANRYNDNGRFVAFKGFEFGYVRGHRNVIYRDCEIEPKLDLEGGFFEYFRGRADVLSIPHHTKVRTDWDYYDPDLEPLVEAYSCWGSGVEHADPLWDKSEIDSGGVYGALARGYRLGFIGSGDSHAGTPGRSYPQDRMWFMHHKSGFACVLARELTRKAIFEALRNKRCYATTGVRAILEFSVNDVVMGGAVKTDDAKQPRSIRVHCIGTEPLSSLRIVKNGVDLVSRSLDRQEEFFEYRDTGVAVAGDWYFAIVVQRDENVIWSSPVWIGD
jgi:hypothetical protein